VLKALLRALDAARPAPASPAQEPDSLLRVPQRGWVKISHSAADFRICAYLRSIGVICVKSLYPRHLWNLRMF
jgi:hypothetical protein